jgi:hypothetical protein
MKNIHLLPTDKPSKIFYIAENFHLEKGQLIEPKSYHNVFITSDEDIKEGDCYLYKETFLDGTVKTEDQFKNSSWGISKATKGDIPYIERAEKGRNTKNGLRGIFKIILTTDQDLINDGVQAIDDEFLEWFVKNPSCESVEAVKEYKDGFGNWYLFQEELFSDHFEPFALRYKIIIPQEEPKQDYSKIKEGLKKSIEGKAHFIQHFKNGGTVEEFKPLESKQETLEEAMDKNGYHDEVNDTMWREGVKFGAKWQQERMYSEEDMINFHKWAYQKNRIEESDKTTKELLKEWFEQFKKK